MFRFYFQLLSFVYVSTYSFLGLSEIHSSKYINPRARVNVHKSFIAASHLSDAAAARVRGGKQSGNGAADGKEDLPWIL